MKEKYLVAKKNVNMVMARAHRLCVLMFFVVDVEDHGGDLCLSQHWLMVIQRLIIDPSAQVTLSAQLRLADLCQLPTA